MLNSERYTTAEERAHAYDRFCEARFDKVACCAKCELQMTHRNARTGSVCPIAWLDLEAEEEKPLPCPFCGSNTVVTSYVTVRHVDNYLVECINCQYRSEEKFDRDNAIAAHNRVAYAVGAGQKEGK